MESHGNLCWQICMQQSKLPNCSGLSEMYAGKHIKLRQDINLLWRTRFPRFLVAKWYYRHNDLTSTVPGRWQHSYYDALCRNFSFAVLYKSNQWVTALWHRTLPAGNDLARFNKIAIHGAPQMAVDKEAICLSRVYSYYSKCDLPLFYV